MPRWFIVLALPLALAAGQSDAKNAEIRRLMEITGTRAMMEQFSGQLYEELLDDIKEKYEHDPTQKIPPKFWDEALGLIMKEVAGQVDKLLERLVPIYDKYLSEQEIKELIRFYETPAGRKILSAMPQIMQESGAVGAAWGREIGPIVTEKISKRLAELQQEEQKSRKK